MNATTTKAPPAPAIPEDDPTRQAAVARPDDDQTLAHWGVVGDTYTILISGEQTAGRYTLIDMHIPTGGGPPPHRHDFEEMFSVIDGAIGSRFAATRRLPAPERRSTPQPTHPTCSRTPHSSRRAPVHVLAPRAGEVLRRDRNPRLNPDRGSTQAR